VEDWKDDGSKVLSRVFTPEMKTTDQRLRNFVRKTELESGDKTLPIYPTPRGSECGVGMCGGTGSKEMLQNLNHQEQITEEKRRSMQAGNGGLLSPVWVEWLMGFPRNWTRLGKHGNHESKRMFRIEGNGSRDWETQSYPRLPEWWGCVFVE
jgi:hypothetical protein